MLKSKTLDILGALSPDEVKEFRIFLSSPYYNTNKTVLKFFDILIKFYPEFNQSSLTKENIYAKLHPGVKYKDEVIRNLLSRLLLLGENYLRVKGFESNEYRNELSLIGELSKRKVASLFEKNVKKLEKSLPKNDTTGTTYLMKFELETEKFNFNQANKRISSPLDIDESMSVLIKRGENLINFFILTLMAEVDFMKKFSKHYNYGIDDTLPMDFTKRLKLPELLDYMIRRKGDNKEIYQIYLNMIRAFDNLDDTKHYKALKKLLIENASVLSMDEKHYLFGKLIDYGVLKNRHDGNSQFDEEHFSNHVMYLENEYYHHSKNKHLPLDLFRNVLIQSFRRKDFKWAEKFINEYIKKLKKEYQENTYHYAMAFLHFQKGDNENALEEINKVAYDMFAFKYDVRNLNLMICYELGNWESVKSIIESYKRFLLNNKMVGTERKEYFGTFLKFLGKLVKIRDDVNKPDKMELDFLRKEIKSAKNFSYKEWLLEKANQL